MQVNIILLDFAKAFNSLPHHSLLHKLEYYGVNPKTNRWFHSILGNRKQTSSSRQYCDVHVPQCTVLRPLLFLAYINDMSETATSSVTKLFADDSLFYHIINNQTDNGLLQRDLTTREDWKNRWQSFNENKCVVIRIASKTNR